MVPLSCEGGRRETGRNRAASALPVVENFVSTCSSLKRMESSLAERRRRLQRRSDVCFRAAEGSLVSRNRGGAPQTWRCEGQKNKHMTVELLLNVILPLKSWDSIPL